MTVRSAIVLAAGEGMRLRPLTRHRPKPMLPAATKPILEHVFDELIEAGIERLTVVVGYGRTAVQSHFGSTYRDVPIEYAIQNKQLGSAHAVAAALPTVDEPSLVVNGDQLIDASIVLKEITYEHAEGFAAGELKHGPLALVTENTPVFAIVTGDGSTARNTISNIKEVEARDAPVVVVTDGSSGTRITFSKSPRPTNTVAPSLRTSSYNSSPTGWQTRWGGRSTNRGISPRA